MTSETLNLYEAFCHKMWTANCSERDAYGETVLRKQEYSYKVRRVSTRSVLASLGQ